MNDLIRIVISVILAFILIVVLKHVFFTAQSSAYPPSRQEHFADITPMVGGKNIVTTTSDGDLSSFVVPKENIVTTDANGNFSSFAFPKGIIVMWSGDLSSIPAGWTLCNGQNGAPDLRGRFIIGTNPTDNATTDKDSNNVTLSPRAHKSQGGEQSHTLSVDEIPAHSHYVGGAISSDMTGSSYGSIIKRDRTGFNTDNTGGGKPHNIIPPYYALAFIMKL